MTCVVDIKLQGFAQNNVSRCTTAIPDPPLGGKKGRTTEERGVNHVMDVLGCASAHAGSTTSPIYGEDPSKPRRTARPRQKWRPATGPIQPHRSTASGNSLNVHPWSHVDRTDSVADEAPNHRHLLLIVPGPVAVLIHTRLAQEPRQGVNRSRPARGTRGQSRRLSACLCVVGSTVTKVSPLGRSLRSCGPEHPSCLVAKRIEHHDIV